MNLPTPPAPLLPAPSRSLIPEGQWPGLLRRLAQVWAVALVIGFASWANAPAHSMFTVHLVYSCAISTGCWFFVDVGRFVLRRPLRCGPPHCWPAPLPAGVLVATGILGGFALGTGIGDWYAGQSTWQLWYVNRGRFVALLVSSVGVGMAWVAWFWLRGQAEYRKQQTAEAQLLLLQAQLEPHMLFNVLANLRALVGTDPARAVQMLDHLDGFLRSTLSASRTLQGHHTLGDEVQRLGDYLGLMAIRMGPRLRFSIAVAAELHRHPVPSFLLQPLVENCIKHALEPLPEGGEIRIGAHRESGKTGDEKWYLTVQDTGPGLAALPDSGSGFGLDLVRQRLHRIYGNKASLQIDNAPGGGTIAQITLPFQLTTCNR